MVAVPPADKGAGVLVTSVQVGVSGRDHQIASRFQIDFALDARRVDVVHILIEVEKTVESRVELGTEVKGSEKSLHLLRSPGLADKLRLDQILDVVAEEIGGEADLPHAVVEAKLISRRLLRLVDSGLPSPRWGAEFLYWAVPSRGVCDTEPSSSPDEMGNSAKCVNESAGVLGVS